jgi:hypothetical protein
MSAKTVDRLRKRKKQFLKGVYVNGPYISFALIARLRQREALLGWGQ